ncbi:MAG: DUF3305 domain-containing protein [Hyphomicrobiaceae bacterium]|nr:DUF3305 domain-containing protein [Hyphomicrobiaceae bacterium]
MSSSISIPVGVVIARESIDHPWQDCVWRPIGVFLNAPEIEEWRELRRDETSVQYHAATLPLELHRKETPAYQVNLETGAPAVYVVLRNDPGAASEWPVSVHLVTASPHDAQAYGESGIETIELVPMPGPLVELVREFVEVHHVEEPFVKRQRQKYAIEAEHRFGQEPIFVLREKMRATRKNDGDG